MAVQDNISTIICNAITINKDPLKEKIKPIINQLEKVFEENKEAILNANKIDQKNRNGFLNSFLFFYRKKGINMLIYFKVINYG